MTLKHFRQLKDYTQASLAKKLSVDQTTISKYEKGLITPSIEQLPTIAKILNCSIEELVYAIIATKGGDVDVSTNTCDS